MVGSGCWVDSDALVLARMDFGGSHWLGCWKVVCSRIGWMDGGLVGGPGPGRKDGRSPRLRILWVL